MFVWNGLNQYIQPVCDFQQKNVTADFKPCDLRFDASLGLGGIILLLQCRYYFKVKSHSTKVMGHNLVVVVKQLIIATVKKADICNIFPDETCTIDVCN